MQKRALAVVALVAALAVSVAYVSSPTKGAKKAECGKERWAVKTLTDTTTSPGAADVDISPVTTTVEKLRKLNAKGKVSSGKPPQGLKKYTPRMAPPRTGSSSIRS